MNRSIIRLVFLSFLLFGITENNHGQVIKPIKWEVSISEENSSSDEITDIIFIATIDENWYLYSSDFDPDLGPMVTEFSFEPSDSYVLVNGIRPIGSKRKYDSLWEGEYTYFNEKGEFRQKIKIVDPNYSIKGSYTYQVCSDIDGKCIPFEDDFEINGKRDGPETISAIKSTVNIGAEQSALDVFLIALLAGLIALATPCVYPMIPMTVSVFMKQGGSKMKGLSMAAVFGGSIIILFTLIGFLVSLIWGFSALNELSTNWLFNLILFTVFIVFALSFFGLFEITLPHRLVNKIDEQADRGGYLGVIFMAITLVVVSFSCTVPIVGTALLTALNDGNLINGTIAMFGFSLAFAIPFTAFALFPSWLKTLPKSGGWLNSVKVVLGFLELALALKFLSIADLAYHWNILDREVFISLWIVIFFLLGLYLLGKIKFKGDSQFESVSISRLFLSIGVFSFVVYLIPGLFGAPLKSLAGFLPPMSTHDFNISVGNQQEREALCEEPLYSDILHWPLGLNGYFDYDQALECSKSNSKPIFVDFTGHGCVNCREMEQRVWSDTKVTERLANNFVLLALYVDDKTELPESEWYTSSYDNKIKKTIGKQNADFQISSFNNNAQPFYLILNDKGELLIDPKAYDLNVDNFVSFLDEGAKAYK